MNQDIDESVHWGEEWGEPLGKGLAISAGVKRKDSKNFRKRTMSETLLSEQVFYTEQNWKF